MNPWRSNSRKAGLLLLLASLFPLGIWALLLFAGTPDGVSKWKDATDFVLFAFSDQNPDRRTFIILAGLPLCLIALAAGYLRHTQFQTRNAVLLFAANLALAALSFVEGPEHLTFFIALPAWWGWKCVTEATNLVPTQ
jgi:hypothetical protein